MVFKKSKQKAEKKKAASAAKFYDPPNVLRQKVGTGGIAPRIIDAAEEYISANPVDLTPLAEEIIKRLRVATVKAREQNAGGKEFVQIIIYPIMELKATGAMFNYHLLTDVAGVMLDFLEDIAELNDDALEIVDVHQRTLEAIIKNRLKGSGGKEGVALAQELYDACQRYRKKYRMLVEV